MIISDSSIDHQIIQMRKGGAYILTIHKWLVGCDSFSQLDEQIVLCDICRILNDSNLAVSRNEVRKVFNKFYNKNFHGEKNSYLNWIYKEFKIKDQTRVFIPQVRKKQAIPQTLKGKRAVLQHNFGLVDELAIKSSNHSKNDVSCKKTESQEPYVHSQDTAPAVLFQLKTQGVNKNE